MSNEAKIVYGKGHPDKLTYAACAYGTCTLQIFALSKSFLCDRFFFLDLIKVNVANVTNFYMFYDSNQFLSDNFLTMTFIALFFCAISCLLLTFPAMLFKNDDLL